MSQTTASRPQVSPGQIEESIRMSGAAADAPLSPHLSVWKWTPAGLTSILHRATGIANAAGATLLTAWLAAGAIGEDAYKTVTGILGSPFGLVVLFGFTWSVMYHLTNGVRFLIWDSGRMLSREARIPTAWAVYGISVALTALVWVAAFTVAGR